MNSRQNMENPYRLETVDSSGNGLDDFKVVRSDKLSWYKVIGNGELETLSTLVPSERDFEGCLARAIHHNRGYKSLNKFDQFPF